jgi:hypothetical protein
LEKNKVLYYNEYYAYQQFGKNQFAAVWCDSATRMNTLVINGKRAATGWRN